MWKLHGAPDEVLTYTNGVGAAFRAARQIRAGRFDRVYVLPHSIRSALVPFLAGVPDRRGLPGRGAAGCCTRWFSPIVARTACTRVLNMSTCWYPMSARGCWKSRS